MVIVAEGPSQLPDMVKKFESSHPGTVENVRDYAKLPDNFLFSNWAEMMGRFVG